MFEKSLLTTKSRIQYNTLWFANKYTHGKLVSYLNFLFKFFFGFNCVLHIDFLTTLYKNCLF